MTPPKDAAEKARDQTDVAVAVLATQLGEVAKHLDRLTTRVETLVEQIVELRIFRAKVVAVAGAVGLFAGAVGQTVTRALGG